MVNKRQNIISLSSFLLGIVAVTGIFVFLHQPPSVKADAMGVKRYVRTNGNDSGNNCTNIATPCRTVQSAVDRSNSGDEILIATGIYTGVQARDSMTQVVYISQTVTVRGGYSSNFNTYDPYIYQTTLDAEGKGRVVSIIGNSVAPLLEGLTLTGGYANGITKNCFNAGGITDGCGGGIFIYGAAPTIAKNIIIHNVAATSSHNHSASGGGLCLYYAYGTVITGNLIISNTASLGERGMGGGISIDQSSDILIEANQILSNVATTHNFLYGWGGGVAMQSSEATIQGNLIQGNRDNGENSGEGTGFYSWYGSIDLLNNKIINNYGQQAIYLGYPGGKTFEANQVVNNNTEIAVFMLGGFGQPFTMSNNIVAQSGDQAISLYAPSDYPQLTRLLHNTLVGNGNGYGVYVGSGDVTLTMTNTIVTGYTWGITNTAPLSSSVAPSYTLFWANSHDGILGDHPLFGDPVFLNPANRDYHLGRGSAAIDAGILTSVNVDVDGDPRPIGSAPDIGADEAWLNLFIPLIMR